jgi:serine/threonine-protein kinase SRPK3
MTPTAGMADVYWDFDDDYEQISRYCRGGYHPVEIGQSFKGRYTIVYKMGSGSFSTVWLAKDHKTSRYVALKFIVASPPPSLQ